MSFAAQLYQTHTCAYHRTSCSLYRLPRVCPSRYHSTSVHAGRFHFNSSSSSSSATYKAKPASTSHHAAVVAAASTAYDQCSGTLHNVLLASHRFDTGKLTLAKNLCTSFKAADLQEGVPLGVEVVLHSADWSEEAYRDSLGLKFAADLQNSQQQSMRGQVGAAVAAAAGVGMVQNGRSLGTFDAVLKQGKNGRRHLQGLQHHGLLKQYLSRSNAFTEVMQELLHTPSGPKVMLHIKPGLSTMAAKGDSLRINRFGVGRGLQVLPGSTETALSGHAIHGSERGISFTIPKQLFCSQLPEVAPGHPVKLGLIITEPNELGLYNIASPCLPLKAYAKTKNGEVVSCCVRSYDRTGPLAPFVCRIIKKMSLTRTHDGCHGVLYLESAA